MDNQTGADMTQEEEKEEREALKAAFRILHPVVNATNADSTTEDIVTATLEAFRVVWDDLKVRGDIRQIICSAFVLASDFGDTGEEWLDEWAPHSVAGSKVAALISACILLERMSDLECSMDFDQGGESQAGKVLELMKS